MRITQDDVAQRIHSRALIGAERVRQAMRDENTGEQVDRIEVIVSRARDAERLAAARRPRPRLRTGAA